MVLKKNIGGHIIGILGVNNPKKLSFCICRLLQKFCRLLWKFCRLLWKFCRCLWKFCRLLWKFCRHLWKFCRILTKCCRYFCVELGIMMTMSYIIKLQITNKMRHIYLSQCRYLKIIIYLAPHYKLWGILYCKTSIVCYSLCFANWQLWPSSLHFNFAESWENVCIDWTSDFTVMVK